jgi:hypothetical protein
MYCKTDFLVIMILSSISGRNYVPRRDADFVKWARKLYDYAGENHERLGIVVIDADVLSRFEYYAALAAKCEDANHIKADEVEKKDARKVAEKDIRNLVQGSLARNVRVTNRDREMMGLPVYDTTPTPINKPLGLATASVSYLGGQVLQLTRSHVDGTPMDKRASYGCKFFYGVYADGDTLPESGEDLPKQRFSRRKRELFEFAPADVKKPAYFCIRYENSKGEAGPWGPMIKAVIP